MPTGSVVDVPTRPAGPPTTSTTAFPTFPTWIWCSELFGNWLVGFAAITPSDDPDADQQRDALIAELAVKPEATRAGHGSRLLNAAVDTARADGFGRITVWVNSTDDVLRAFYTEAGWAPDGAHRELDLYGDESVRIKQIRLHTDPAATD